MGFSEVVCDSCGKVVTTPKRYCPYCTREVHDSSASELVAKTLTAPLTIGVWTLRKLLGRKKSGS